MKQSLFTRMLFESPLLRFAKFRASPAHPGFRDSGPARQHCFVFPRTTVRIQHAGDKPFTAGPNLITLYNQGQTYLRERITDEGDRCEWFSVEPSVLIEVLAAHDPSIQDHPEQPFQLPFAPADPQTYLLQRLVVRHATESERIDRLFVEEAVLRLLDRVAASAARFRGVAQRAAPTSGTGAGEVVDAVREILGTRFREDLSLADLGRRTGYSVFHLSRVFREKAGLTLHAYQNRMRLLTALERVAEPGTDLARVALDLGYASHSHFTAAFRRAFGVTPSAFRVTASAQRARELAGRLEGTEGRRTPD
jgi:AraC family transcriptional regulator